MSDKEKERLAERKNDWFIEAVENMNPDEIFPGVRTMISDLRSAGLAVGLASSSKNAQTVVERLDIQSLFEVIVDGTMITHTKPDPEIFLLTADRLHRALADESETDARADRGDADAERETERESSLEIHDVLLMNRL